MRTKLCPVTEQACARQICLKDKLCDKRDLYDDEGRWHKPGPPPRRPPLEGV